MLAIVGTVVVAALFGFLVTTFLFAFSGGQFRMQTVVGYGFLAMLVVPIAAAALVWRLRSPVAALVAAFIATAGGWIVTLIVEWVLSFSLGAS